MRAPETYAEWLPLLAALAEGQSDEDLFDALRAGKIVWQSGVAERFAKHFADALNARLNRATDRFQTRMKTARGEQDLSAALRNLRRQLQQLEAIAALPALPKEQQDAYRQLVREQMDRIQKSLEDSAKRDRSGLLAHLVRSQPVNR